MMMMMDDDRERGGGERGRGGGERRGGESGGESDKEEERVFDNHWLMPINQSKFTCFLQHNHHNEYYKWNQINFHLIISIILSLSVT